MIHEMGKQESIGHDKKVVPINDHLLRSKESHKIIPVHFHGLIYKDKLTTESEVCKNQTIERNTFEYPIIGKDCKFTLQVQKDVTHWTEGDSWTSDKRL